MTQEEKRPTGLLTSTVELRQLIVDNPDLPMLVFAGEDANCGGDYNYMACSLVRAYIGEYLDCQQTVNDCRCYNDRDDFEEDLSERLANDFDGTDKEFEEYVEKTLMEYDPYWKPCIVVYVDN